jgi:hypothetical protein
VCAIGSEIFLIVSLGHRARVFCLRFVVVSVTTQGLEIILKLRVRLEPRKHTIHVNTIKLISF